MEPILVTGAAGQARGAEAAPSRRVQQGGTGLLVTRRLLELGHDVRAFVRVDDERAGELRDLGVEVFVGDLRSIADVAPALQGVRRAYFNYPVRPGMLEAVAVFAAAARQAGLERVVDVSQLGAGSSGGTPHMRRHWVAEQTFDAAGVGAVHLQGSVFYENIATAIEAGGGQELALPLGSPETEVPLVAGSDVARVAIGVLTADDVEPGPVVLTGEVPSIGKAAEAFGVPYNDIDPDEWAARCRELYQDPVSFEHLTNLWAMFKSLGHIKELFHVTEPIERLGGLPPVTLKDFAASL